MGRFEFNAKTYDVDDEDFLLNPDQWDSGFAEGIAPRVGIDGRLTEDHWMVIRFIRERFLRTGRFPMVYETCKVHRLLSGDLQKLFPTGYLRGACKLAGLNFRAEEQHPSWLPEKRTIHVATDLHQRVYRVNVRGFLVDPAEWDEDFAVFKAQEIQMPGGLTGKHWQIIHFLREEFNKSGKVPTVFETCVRNRMEIDELESLFPQGYHRGAVKLAGLRAV